MTPFLKIERDHVFYIKSKDVLVLVSDILKRLNIKKHKPRFNILLRDDKSFPYIYIGHKDKWPQLTKLRGKKSRDGYYFGPFASIGSANWTIKILQKIFQIRVCDDNVFKNRERPCILYQIKRCSAPCVGHINEDYYKKTVADAIDFISGKSRNCLLYTSPSPRD